MKIKLKEREFQIWGILTITIISVWLIVIWMLFDSQSNNEKVFLDVELKRFEGEVNSTLMTYQSFSNYIFDEIEQDEVIMSIIHQANTSSVKEKEVLREELYNKLHNQYLNMKKYEFRQLHFHLPSTESFLRVHAPDKYGDLLSDSRESIRLVNKNKKTVIGFEEGRIVNGYRYVYPLEYNDSYVGSVEVSISSASILEVISKLYGNEDFRFIIEKSAVKANAFNEEMLNYRDSYVFDDYYVDKEVDKIIEKYTTVAPKSIELFNKGLKEEYSERLKKKESFAAIYKFEGKDYVVKFLSVKNIKKEPIAYLMSISENNVYKQFNKVMLKEIVLVTLLAFFIIVFGLVLAFYQYKLKNTAEIDFLTKIYNRNKFYQIIEREIKDSKRYKCGSFVMLLDIDFFKKVNDTYGHEWGDRVLQKLASEISQSIRRNDVFARWGGEEFVLLLPNVKKEEALNAAERIRKLIEESQSPELKDITISVGISEVDYENYDIDASIKVADEAMYYAKENGRNQVCYK